MRTQVEHGRIKPGPTPPYGYVFTGKNKEGLAINEEVAPIVRFIYQSIDDGMSLHGVAKTLNEMGVLTPSRYLDSQGLWPEKKRDRLSGNWRRQSIAYALRTRPIADATQPIATRRSRTKTASTSRASLTIRQRRVELPGLVPAIVSEAQWERVQAAVKTGHSPQRRGQTSRISRCC